MHGASRLSVPGGVDQSPPTLACIVRKEDYQVHKSFVILLAAFIPMAATHSILMAQTVIRLDTVYTPQGYVDGPLVASIFIPDSAYARGIGVVLGHYMTGDRLTAKVWCDTLAARGYLAMTIDYSDIGSVPNGVYPKPVRAFKIAVEFLRRNAGRFGIKTNKIVGFGQSQGSLVWGQTIIWDNDDAYFRTDSTIDDHLNAAILLYGAYDISHFDLTWEENAVAAYFSPDPSLRTTKGQCIANTANIRTPLLLIHGTADVTLDVSQSRRLLDSLLSHGRPCELVEYNAGHGFDIIAGGPFTAGGLAAKDAALDYLGRVLSPGPKGIVSPASMDFGVVDSENFVDKTFFITNYSDDTLRISSIVSSDPSFTARPTTASIAPRQSLVDTVCFNPPSGDTIRAFIVVLSNGTLSPDTVRVSGIGSPLTYVRSNSSNTPLSYALGQNYPNPFNPSTKIGYRVQGSGYGVVTLKVYDIIGREVATLVNEKKAPGMYEVTFDGSGLASGVYFYRLEAGTFVQTKKLLLLR